MRFYLAARYSRRKELCEYRTILRDFGHEVTSRWLDGDYPTDDQGRSLEAPLAERQEVATQDLEDLMRASVVVSFTEPPRSTNGRGGRHVEFGLALATGRKCVVIGPRENVFHCLGCVDWFPDWYAFVRSGWSSTRKD